MPLLAEEHTLEYVIGWRVIPGFHYQFLCYWCVTINIFEDSVRDTLNLYSI